MVFNSQTWADPPVTKGAMSELTAQNSAPPIAGAYQAGPQGFPSTAAWHLDPAVTQGPPRRDPQALGVLVRNGNPSAAARISTHTAPGEPALAVVTPAITKAAGDFLASDGVIRPTAGQNRTPDTARAGSVSGTATPLASLRQTRRPDGLAAGHVDLDQQPKPFGGGGPQNAAQAEPGLNASGRGVFDTIPQPCRLPITVPVSRLDLRSPAGLPSGLVRTPDPQPVSRPSPTLGPQASGTSGQTQVPQHPRSAFMGAPDGPLAASIARHSSSPPAFGFTPSQATGRAPGE